MSDVWDRTVEVLRGRASMLAAIAALLVFVPAALQAAAQAMITGALTGGPPAVGTAGAILLIVLVVVVVRLWGNAAIVAAGSDPAHDRGSAMAHGARRLPALLGVSALLGLAALVLMTPFIALLGASLNWTALARGHMVSPAALPPFGALATGLAYVLVLFLIVLFVVIRLILLSPVIVNERLGIGAIGRAWRLTRGSFWRIFGVLFLFGLVFLIATSAATLLIGIVARLVLGASHVAVAAFAGQLGAAAVTSAYAVVTGVFTAQLYRTLTGREAAETFA